MIKKGSEWHERTDIWALALCLQSLNQKWLSSASRNEEFTLTRIQKWTWFFRAWLKAELLTGWRGWGSAIAAVGKVTRRVWSQETPSVCYRLCQLCCLSSGISHSLQIRRATKRWWWWWWWWWWCRNRTWAHRGRQAGRQAGIQVQASPVNRDKTGDRSETRQHTVSVCTLLFLTNTVANWSVVWTEE